MFISFFSVFGWNEKEKDNNYGEIVLTYHYSNWRGFGSYEFDLKYASIVRITI